MPTIQNLDMYIGQAASWVIKMLPVVDISLWEIQFTMTPMGQPPTFGSKAFLPPIQPWPMYRNPYVPPIIGPANMGPVITKNNLIGGGGIVITNGPGGQYQINIDAADTTPLVPGVYNWSSWRLDVGNQSPLSEGYVYLY